MIGISAFIKQAQTRPEALAITAENDYLTFGELLDRAQRLAVRLNRYAATNEFIIGLSASDTIGFYIAVLACWLTRRAYVPLRLSDPSTRNQIIVQTLELKTLIATEQSENPASNWMGLQSVDLLNLNIEAPLSEWQEPADEQLAYVLFTSGSTGQPKGVPIRWNNLNTFSRALLQSGIYDFNLNDRFLQTFQPTFDLSVFSFWIPLQVGASTHVVSQKGRVALNASFVLEEKSITVAMLTPSLLTYLRPYFGDLHLPALRYSLFCGEPLPHDLMVEWSACVPNAQIENVYGPTESTVFCSRYSWHKDASAAESWQGIVPIGTALPGMTLCIDAAPEETGELLLMGQQVFQGYWNSPELTSKVLRTLENGERIYRSGDRCRRLPNGVFQYIERIDFQVKVDGYRIELGEIEHHARRLTKGALVAAVALSTSSSSTLILFVKGKSEEHPTLNTELKEHLPYYMIPRQIFFIEELPLTSSGKIDRQALKAMADQSAAGATGLT